MGEARGPSGRGVGLDENFESHTYKISLTCIQSTVEHTTQYCAVIDTQDTYSTTDYCVSHLHGGVTEGGGVGVGLHVQWSLAVESKRGTVRHLCVTRARPVVCAQQCVSR